MPKDVRVDSLQMIGNGLALAEASNEPSAPAVPRTINVLDISHPEHPQLIQSFAGVTAMAVSFDFNLLFFANNEGTLDFETAMDAAPRLSLRNLSCYSTES